MHTRLRALGWLLVLLIAPLTFGQGTVVFNNRVLGDGGVDAPVYDTDGVTPLAGDAYLAQLYAGPSADLLAAVGAAVAFRTNSPKFTAAGYFYVLEPSRSIPSVLPGAVAAVEVRAWEKAAGLTYEDAVNHGGKHGRSAGFTVKTGGLGEPPSLPTVLTGLRSFHLVVTLAPKIESQSGPQTLALGAPLQLGVTASGTAPLGYQWYKDGVLLAGATSEQYEVGAVTAGDAGSYTVAVSNEVSKVTSAPMVVTVVLPPGLPVPLLSKTVIAGESFELVAAPNGTPPFQYQWRLNGTNLPDATNATLNLATVSGAAAGEYTVVISNTAGVFVSDPATLTVEYRLVLEQSEGGLITAEPVRVSYAQDASVTLQATAEAGYTFVQWAGTTNSSLNPLTIAMDRNHEVSGVFAPVAGTVFFANYGGDLNAPVFDTDGTTLLADTNFLAQLYGGPTAEALEPVGAAVPFRTGLAAGYIHGVQRVIPTVAPGATAYVQMRAWAATGGASYEAALAAGMGHGTSVVVQVVTGGAGSPPTLPATITGLQPFQLMLGQPPEILTAPTNVVVVLGAEAAFEVVARGTEPIFYQWLHNGAPVAEVTGARLEIASATLGDAGEYRVAVSNAVGQVLSDPVSLTVLVPPTIAVSPVSQTVLAGTATELTVQAGGTPPVHYQWYAGLVDDLSQPVGSDQPSFQTPELLTASTYWVRVSNVAGFADSEAAVLTVEKRSQTIAFAPIPDLPYGGSPFKPTATASSGLPVSLAVVSGPATLVEGAFVFSGIGPVVVVATQPGDALFAPAVDVERGFAVTKGQATLELAGLHSVYSGSPQAVTVTTVPAGLAVALTYDGSPTPPAQAGTYAVVAAINDSFYEGSATGSLVIGKASATVELTGLTQTFDGAPKAAVGTTSPLGLSLALTYDGNLQVPSHAGTYAVVATVQDSNYEGTASGSLRILKAAQTLSFELPASAAFGDPPITLTASASSGLAAGFAVLSGPAAIEGTLLTLQGAGAVVVRASQNGDDDHEAAPAVERTVVVAKAKAAIQLGELQHTFDGTPKAVSVATTPAGLKVIVTYPDGQPPVHAGDYEVTATLEEANYEATVTSALRIAKAQASVQLAGLEQIADGQPKPVVATTTPAGLRVVLTYDGQPAAPSKAGQYEVLASVDETDYAGSASAVLRIRDIATLACWIFEDANGNGRRDEGETGLPGAAIRLTQEGIEHTATTDKDGVCRFDALEMGVYNLSATPPAGYTHTSVGTQILSLTQGGEVKAEFGVQLAQTISGLVFADVNGNGSPDSGEAGMEGVTIRLSGEAARETTTGADGAFRFSALPAGVYTVAETHPAGYVSTTPALQMITLGLGGSASANFGEQPLQTIAGTVFDDRNGDGVQGAGEPGIGDVRLRLVRAADATEVGATVSAGDGTYAFTDVQPGNYLVEQEVPSGYTVLATYSTTPAAAPAARLAGLEPAPVLANKQVDLLPGKAVNVSFPLYLQGTVSGEVFLDLNGDGLRSGSESGLAGAGVELTEADTGMPIASTVSGAGGSYRFEQVQPGQYTVRQTALPGYLAPHPEVTVLLDPMGAAAANFANLPQGTVSGRVFHDGNGNGRLEAAEYGLAGVPVKLTNTDNGQTMDGTTAADGSFLFLRVASGTIAIEETDPAGFHSTTTNRVVRTLELGGAMATSFGDQSDTLRSPLIVKQPARLRLAPGAEGTFEAVVEGTATLAIQWYKDGVHLPGATNTSLTVKAAASSDVGAYTVEVSNLAGTAVSDPAWLTLSAVDPYRQWVAVQSIASEVANPQDDPDSDGAANLIEFVLGSDPARPDTGLGVRVVTVQKGDGLHLAVNFPRAAAAASQRYGLSASSDLVQWTDVASTLEVIGTLDETEGLDLVQLLDPQPIDGVTHRFLRLRVELAPVVTVQARLRIVQAPLAAAGLRLELSGEPGTRYAIEYSSNLRDWSYLRAATLGLNPVVVDDPASYGKEARFYRVHQAE